MDVVEAASGAPCSVLEQRKVVVKCSSAREQQSPGSVGWNCLSIFSIPHFLSVLLIWYSHASYQISLGFFPLPDYFYSYICFHGIIHSGDFLFLWECKYLRSFLFCTNKQKTTRFSRWAVLWGSSEALDLISLTPYLSLPNLPSFFLVFHWANNNICVNQELSCNSSCHKNFTMPYMIKTSYFLPNISSLLTVSYDVIWVKFSPEFLDEFYETRNKVINFNFSF